jgi:hypothetical protein
MGCQKILPNRRIAHKVAFFKGTHPCQPNNSKAIRDINQRFFVSCTQVNLWHGKRFVLFHVNQFTSNRALNLPVFLRQNMGIFKKKFFLEICRTNFFFPASADSFPYLLRGPAVTFCHFFSQNFYINFYIIRLFKTTYPIKFSDSSKWAQISSE